MKWQPFPAVLFLLASGMAHGQSMTLVTGSVNLLEGTTMRFEGPLTWTLAAGTGVINDGTIDFGSEATLEEPLDGPITGNGTELAMTMGPGPFSAIEPGGLGLVISNTEILGPLVVTRGHLPFTLPEGDLSIARWFGIESAPAFGSSLLLTLRYDPSELNGLDAASLALFEASSEVGPWSALASTAAPVLRTVTATDQYPWDLVTAFDENATTLSPTLIAANGFQVWPTVVDDVLTVVSMTEGPIRTLEVIDGLGRVVPNATPYRTGPQCLLDVSGLSPGAYFLRVNSVHVFKFRKS